MTKRIPSWLRAGLWTAVFTFTALFGLSLLDVLSDVLEWAATEEAEFPDLSVLAKGTVTAVASALAGLVNAAVRWAQERLGKGNTPVYVTRSP